MHHIKSLAKSISRIRLWFLAFMFFVNGTHMAHSQEIFVSTLDDEIYILDLTTCTYSLKIAKVDERVFDISFHPNGNLYGISPEGLFYQILMSGSIIPQFQFPETQSFNSLTISADEYIYTAGDEGQLYRNKIGQNPEYLGDFGPGATGDLTFHDGKLYAAVVGDNILEVNFSNLPSSKIVIDENVMGSILGIVSYAEDCAQIETYAITDEFSDVYRINFSAKSLELVCQLGIEIGGGASTYEFYASAPITHSPPVLTFPTCGSSNGQIEITGSGGSGTLQYALNSMNFQSSGHFTGLPGGTYTIYIRDENNCSVPFTVQLPDRGPPVLSDLLVGHPTCNLQNGSIQATHSGGTAPFRYTLNQQPTQSTSLFTNLAPGTYSIKIEDVNSCLDTAQTILTMQPVPVWGENEVTDTRCGRANGSLNLSIENGIPPYAYSIQSLSFSSTSHFESLHPGEYIVQARDANNCILSDTLYIESSDFPVINQITIQEATCGVADGAIEISAAGGIGSIQYELNDGGFQAHHYLTGLSPGIYALSVKDLADCQTDTAVLVPQNPCPIYFANVFTPNHDRINDAFALQAHPAIRARLEVFTIHDRWGNMMFNVNDLSLPAPVAWNGNAFGQEAPPGVYVYHARILHENGALEVYTGDVTLIR